MTKTKAKREPTYLLDCVLPPTDVIAEGFLAKHTSAAGLGMLVGALMAGRKGATIGAASAGFARWVRWWVGR